MSAGTFSAVTDNNDGTYTSVFTAITSGSATNIIASIAGQNVTTASPAITVTAGTATHLGFAQAPTATASGSTISPDITVEALDAYNNRVTSYATDIVIAIHTNPSGSTLSGTLTRNPSSGVSTFNDLAINFYGTGYRLTATSGTLTAAVSPLFNISATAITYDLPFTSITVPVYTTLYSSSSWSNMEFVGDLVRLTPTIQTDTAAVTGTMDAGDANGVLIGALTDGTQGLKIGNGGGCNGSTSDCAKQNAKEIYELHSSWTPQYNNIIGYWKLDGNTGAIASGAVVPATIGSAGGVSATTGNSGNSLNYIESKVAQGIEFNGDQVELPAMTPTLPITISFWAKPYTATPIGMFDSAPGIGDVLRNNPAGYIEWWNGNPQVNLNLTANQWVHLVVTYRHDGTSRIIDWYKNGVKQTSASAVAVDTIAWTNMRLGSINTGGVYGTYSGVMDEFAIFNTTALTSEEVHTIYERQKSQYSGTYTSRIMDAKSTSAWTTLTWFPTLPFLKELPDAGCVAPCAHTNNEISTDYSSLVGSTGVVGANDLMSNITGLWHFNETSLNGSVGEIKDDSGNGHNGAAVNGATITNGKFKNAAYLDGANDYVQIPDSNLLDLTDNFTISMWFKGNAFGGRLIDKCTAGFADGYMIDTYLDKIRFCGVVNCWSTNATLSPGVWYHATITYQNQVNGVKFYLNGVLDNTITDTGPISTNAHPLRIGAQNPDGANVFSGSIDEVAIWRRPLHADEVKQLYQRGASRLKYQVRSCLSNDPTCAAATWKGPDGTSATYFSELNNNTIALSSAGDVKKTAPVMDWTTANAHFPAVNTLTSQYFQYRTIFESDSATAALRPELKSIAVDPVHYSTFLSTNTTPGNTIIGQNSVAFSDLNAFTQTLGAGGCSSGVTYNLALSNTGPWKYWNNVIWTNADGSSAQSNTAASLVASSNAALTAFKVDVGKGPVYVKAFLNSSGTSRCEIDNIQIGGNR